jgi:hypothetical protein
LNHISASALLVGIEPDFCAAAAKAYFADLAGLAPLLKSKPSNFKLAPAAAAPAAGAVVVTAVGLADRPVWTPVMSLARNDVNSSVDSSPLPLLSTVRIRDRAISWMDAPGWIGFIKLSSWSLGLAPGHDRTKSKQGAQPRGDGKSGVFAGSSRTRCRRPDTGRRAGIPNSQPPTSKTASPVRLGLWKLGVPWELEVGPWEFSPPATAARRRPGRGCSRP